MIHKTDAAPGHKLSMIEGIIWDLDNTLYRLDALLIDIFNEAMARAVLAHGLDMAYHDAVKLARRSFDETGYSGRYFVQRHGIDPRTLHIDFHGHIDEKVIKSNAEVKELFESLDLRHALITHGARDWAMRVLLHLELKRWFPSEHIFALEDYNFKRKSESPDSFVRAIEALQLPPERLLFADDTADNLRIPYELGMTTVFIHHGQLPEKAPPWVHLALKNAGDVLKSVKAHRGEGRTRTPP